MKRAAVLLSLAAVVSATSYLLGSPAAALVGVAIMAHYSLARAGFRPLVKVERHLPERGTEREPLKAVVKIENLSSLSGIVRIRETSDKAFARELKVFLRPGERKYLEQTVVPQAKGRISLRAGAVFEDELGLFKKDFPVIESGDMTVFPSPKSIREAMREKRQIEALSEAEKALGIGAETLDFEELREFLPGDDITKIDWKATSRLQKLIVRVFKRETMADVYLLINVDPGFHRELKTGKTDYLVLIISQLVAYFRRFGHNVRVIAYDERGVVKVVDHVSDPFSLIQELGLRGEKGLPALRPAAISGGSSLGRLVTRLKGGSEAHGIMKAALKVPTGSFVLMVDDLGLHPGEIMKASRLLQRRASRAALLYPNPVFFVDKGGLNEEELEVLYKAYRERKTVMKKVMAWVRVIEVGPKDLLPVVVRKL
ncbi:hypothetical protein A3L11_03570 [Thermococcus siculi]|uniref:DUF58 domain-containing protein n=1 Tax=Thermococcus siculi TaxID=72803 RepID=A0A2Z2MIY5_9EURY|nr:DUF58 domain-containing protein [Thermococcus siculi]ASJ08359.1 hypothetical protein A3L11_03570 [Thermococcus siculi]